MQEQNNFTNNKFRQTMFPAQILKDASMAFRVKNIMKEMDVTGRDKFLVVCGLGHMLYSHGVPERIFANGVDNDVNDDVKERTLRIACLPVSKSKCNREIEDGKDEDDDDNIVQVLKDAYGGPEFDAADVCFMYVEEEDEDEDDNDNDENDHSNFSDAHHHHQIRKETKQAYDKVGKTAHLEGGDMSKAHSILRSLHYTQEEIDHVGEDAVNYQGVGCPHRHVDIGEGDSVLDMGSGLGIDSLIAASRVVTGKGKGKGGRVVGIDISAECVRHANKRASERGVDSSTLSYVHSPIERIVIGDDDDGDDDDNKIIGLLAESSFDVVISNGAFCLLPDKEAGFSECYRLLKPGGKIAICTTVLKEQLEGGMEWPLCMQTFAKMEDILPLLEKVGFTDIEIDMSDSLMEIEEVPPPEESDDDDDDDVVETTTTTSEIDPLIRTPPPPPTTQISDKEEDIENDDEVVNSRFKVHNEEGGRDHRYQHLELVDMNSLCARVVIKATKKH